MYHCSTAQLFSIHTVDGWTRSAVWRINPYQAPVRGGRAALATIFGKPPPDEHDACGLWAWVNRDAKPSSAPILTALNALDNMSHRAGMIDGEGDGAGLMLDIPRVLWAEWLAASGHDPGRVHSPAFGVGHFFLPPGVDPGKLRAVLDGTGVTVLLERPGAVDVSALGPLARQEQLTFWQVAFEGPVTMGVLTALWQLEQHDIAVLSWSHDTVVYKLRGAGGDLARYFRDLVHPGIETVSVLGHVRYSTNTTTKAARAQPFRLLGHNGEINTIARLRKTAQHLGIHLPDGGSDSQDLSRFIEALMVRDGLGLDEAVGLLFPPVASLARALPAPEALMWERIRAAVGPVAQGPAAIIARAGSALVASQDALGLRPLWILQTDDGMGISSEPGVLPLSHVRPPEPLGPGEKLVWTWGPGGIAARRTPHFERHVAERLTARLQGVEREWARTPWTPPPLAPVDAGALAFETNDLEVLEAMAAGSDPIGSLGFDGPLPALDTEPGLTADYLQETVAVVTNPAIDRERESVHFSTEVILGPRPWWHNPRPWPVCLPTPLMRDGGSRESPVPDAVGLDHVGLPLTRLAAWWTPGESGAEALGRLAEAARAAVQDGAVCLLLDDQAPSDEPAFPLDPVLAVATVARALESATRADGVSLRREAGIIVRSSLVRRLHDIVVLLGVGADAVLPYRLWQMAETLHGEDAVRQVARVLREGIEKVLSTMGIHELAGYGPIFSAIGLSEDVANLLDVPLMVRGATDVATVLRGIQDRVARGGGARRPYHLYPKLFKLAQTAAVTGDIEPYAERLRQLEQERPIALRHLLDIREAGTRGVDPHHVSLQVGEHRLPFVIGSMSFGSQGETAFRAYLKGAALAGMLAMNGEGGEIPDLIPLWRQHRGIQVASGRFGITAEVVGTARYLEIKIGQGAKPGEGGHLPARKVSPAVAEARKSQQGVDLISPSNNHDLYSIEDLAELIYELKTVAPDAKVAVKVPVVPNIGTIAVGIAKAGADIINLSGYEGGTGAARRHAQRYVGLPSDLGTVLVHRALVAAGLRSHVEIWADGGMRGPDDVLKLTMLGANRVGFGTLAMVAAGCTICRACQTDTCHVGIATQIRTIEEAGHHGLKRFVPRDLDTAADHIARFFTALGEGVKARVAKLGAHRLQDLVGRAALLEQTRGLDAVDLSPWLSDVPIPRSLAGTLGAPHENRRALQVASAGTRIRQSVDGDLALAEEPELEWIGTAGQGLAAFHTHPMVTRIRGGAQDGVAKAMSGGTVVVHGSVGKSLAYGATGGRLMVMGQADTRACIRLSGGEVVLGGWPTLPVDGSLERASLKGYAFEYMTGGLVVTLGDPGPWICAGMTGGAVVCLLHPDLGIDAAYIRHRLAPSAKVSLHHTLRPALWHQVTELLAAYIAELRQAARGLEASQVEQALADPSRWLAILPRHAQADPSISTE
jgi:glutamate synthase (NADPH/NADH) large chain